MKDLRDDAWHCTLANQLGCMAVDQTVELLLSFPLEVREAVMRYRSVLSLEQRADSKHDEILKTVYGTHDFANLKKYFRADRALYRTWEGRIEARRIAVAAQDLFTQLDFSNPITVASVAAACNCDESLALQAINLLLNERCLRAAKDVYWQTDSAVLRMSSTCAGRQRLRDWAKSCFPGSQVRTKQCFAHGEFTLNVGRKSKKAILNYLDCSRKGDVIPVHSTMRALEERSGKDARSPNFVVQVYFAENRTLGQPLDRWLDEVLSISDPLHFPRVTEVWLNDQIGNEFETEGFGTLFKAVRDRIKQSAGKAASRPDRGDVTEFRFAMLARRLDSR